MKETDWKKGLWRKNKSKIYLMEVRGLDTCGLGQGQLAGTIKHGNEISNSIPCGGGRGGRSLRAESLLSL
jgi:hypothetical protein